MTTDSLLQEMLAQRIKEAGYEQMTELFIRKISKKGHKVSSGERGRLKKWLVEGGVGTFSFDDGKAEEKSIRLDVSPREQRRMFGKVRQSHLVDT